jgi:uncharacterized protein
MQPTRPIDCVNLPKNGSDADYLNAFMAHAISVSYFADPQSQFVEINDCDSEGDSLLHIASIMGDLRAVKLLLAAGANVNARGDMDKLPLHCAAGSQYLDIARLLLEAGSVQIKDSFGYTPLEWAQQMGAEEVISLLEKFAFDG